MRRPLALVSLFSAALLLAACSSSSQPGWTYAPETPSAEASAAPSGSAPAASGPAASTPASPEGSGSTGGESPSGEAIELTAQGIQWVEKDLKAPADTLFVIRFHNEDAGTPHNVEIKKDGQTVFKADIFSGVETRDEQIPALAAGSYEYVCTVHPNMVGTLTVGG